MRVSDKKNPRLPQLCPQFGNKAEDGEASMTTIEAWFKQIPVVTRVYVSLSVVTTAACALELISPLNLYLNFKLVREKMEVPARANQQHSLVETLSPNFCSHRSGGFSQISCSSGTSG